MAQSRKQTARTANKITNDTRYIKLENRLILLAWLNSLLGYKQNRDLLEDSKDVAEGFDASGRSFIYYHLISRGSKIKIPAEDLERYDENIFMHLQAMNRRRSVPITLRYFQYLAALYTEIFLERYFNCRARLLADLNILVAERNAAKLSGEPADEEFVETDLTKLAFWMATGSGKTLLLHLNYYQYLYYAPELPDNILLITPNEGLSEQHLEELSASGIPAGCFALNSGGFIAEGRNTVQVIEITKLVEEKRGGGISVPVETFEGSNLIFVDEGHKGTGGKVWRGYREALGEMGFTFEYSATFGQALSAARKDHLTVEYGKSIVFNYSYRYFYGDGYGKDFRILNLKEDGLEEHTSMLFLGNLLSFYEQQCVFKEETADLRLYNLEKPLWVFVGSSVNAVYRRKKKKRSDVLILVRFLHHVLENKNNWVQQGIEKLLAGKSGLQTAAGRDIFAERFKFLKVAGLAAAELYADILTKFFHAPAGGVLHLSDLRGHAGELGLKASGADHYFGLIYIGDTPEFKRLVENDQAGIVIEEDVISGSLFENINRPDSQLNTLIGAKKFMEGWNSWRVSNMGLLNIGRREGSQIIQLLGRGVRLRGKGRLLKRSAALEGTHPPWIGLLETLNIFAVRANYMAQFRDYLEREGVETEEAVELQLSIWTNEQFLKRGLVLPRTEKGRDFVKETSFLLEADPAVQVSVGMSAQVQALESDAAGLRESEVRSGTFRAIPDKSLALIDWEQIYLGLLEYKERKGMENLVVSSGAAQRIIANGNYRLITDEAVVRPRTFKERALLQEAAMRILRKYINSFYRRQREKWEGVNLVYKTLQADDPNLALNRELVREWTEGAYVLKIKKSEKVLLTSLEKLCEDVAHLHKSETGELPCIYFARHLYLPLLLKQKDKLTAFPPGLEKSEEQFVLDLKEYWEKEKEKAMKGKEIFLLRNLSRGRGVGFFEENGFYPDFILWVIDASGHGQRVVFIEPHGMIHSEAYIYNEKARLHERLPELAKKIEGRSRKKGITLDSFIISATSHADLYKRFDDGTWDRAKFASKHILFLERNAEYDYIKIILN